MKKLTHEQIHEADAWVCKLNGYVSPEERACSIQAYWAREDKTAELWKVIDTLMTSITDNHRATSVLLTSAESEHEIANAERDERIYDLEQDNKALRRQLDSIG